MIGTVTDKINSNRDELDEQDPKLDDIEREILHLGEDGDRCPSQADLNDSIPRIPAHSNDVEDSRDLKAGSPKRRRPSPDRDSPDIFDCNYKIETDDEGFEQPTPKKQRRTSRRNPKAEARGELLQKLEGRRRSTKPQRASIKVNNKPKKKTRSLPVDELVIVSSRFEDSDAEAADEGRRPQF